MKIYSPYFKDHPIQQEILTHTERWQIVDAGRRFGKGNLALRKSATIALRYPGCRIWIVSPNYSFTQPMWDKALNAYGAMRIGGYKFVKKTRIKDRSIQFYNGSAIEFKSSVEPDSLRGAGDLMEFLIMDEAAYCEKEAWKAVRPALMDRKAPAMFITTPNRNNPKNWLYDLWLRGQDTIPTTCPSCSGMGCEECGFTGVIQEENPGKRPAYKSWQYSTYDNPFIDDEEISDFIEEEGTDWSELDLRREIYADFLGGEAAVFPYAAVKDCEVGHEEDYDISNQYILGIDLGRVESWTVIIVLRIPQEEYEAPRIVKMERFQGPWPVQKRRIADVAQRFGQPPVFIDATGLGDPLQDELRGTPYDVRRIIPIKFSGRSKPQMVEALSGAIAGQSISWPPYKEMEKELLNMEGKSLPTGMMQYRHAKGFHDDIPMAMALAYWGYLKLGGSKGSNIWISGIEVGGRG